MRSRKKVFYDGEINTLTSINDTGEFDILAHHAQFITMIKDFVILNKSMPSEQKIELKSGVLSVFENKIDIYVDI